MLRRTGLGLALGLAAGAAAAQDDQARMILDMTRDNWVAVRDWDGQANGSSASRPRLRMPPRSASSITVCVPQRENAQGWFGLVPIRHTAARW